MMPTLPDDIVIVILTCLPVRSLLRFKCVSICWRSIISDPSFAKSHLQMSLSSGSSTKNRVFISTYPLRSIDYNQWDNPITEFYIRGITSQPSVRIMGSHNGLVCLLVVGSVILYNPSTRRYRSIKLPKSDVSALWCGFGFDSRSQEYKVVRQVYGKSHHYELFSLTNIDQATAPREIHCDLEVEEGDLGTFVNGSIHWLCEEEGKKRILRLDLAQELFDEFPTPHVQNEPNLYHVLSTLGGCLSLTSSEADDSFGIWVMSEYGVNTSWTKMMVIPIDTSGDCYVLPLAFRSETEILLKISEIELVIFNSEDKDGLLEDVYDDEDNNNFDASIYMESLISP